MALGGRIEIHIVAQWKRAGMTDIRLHVLRKARHQRGVSVVAQLGCLVLVDRGIFLAENLIDALFIIQTGTPDLGTGAEYENSVLFVPFVFRVGISQRHDLGEGVAAYRLLYRHRVLAEYAVA